MFYVIKVVKIDELPFFEYEDLRFDMFLAQFLAWNTDQTISVTCKEGKKGTIGFFDAGLSEPLWMFDYRGSLGSAKTSVLHAYQFDEGDCFSFFTNSHCGMHLHLPELVRNFYRRHRFALCIDRYGKVAFGELSLVRQRELGAAFRQEVDIEMNLLGNKPFRFPVALSRLAMR